MTKKEDIISMGKTIHPYFVKNKTYPKSVKIKGVDYTIQQATYLMASFIANPQKEIPVMKVGGAKAPSGDRINRRVTKSTYQDMSKRLIQFIKQNGKLPNYVTIDGKQKCSIILFMFQLSKIINAYDGAFPSGILINSNDLVKKTYKKYGHATRQGCDNMGQNNGYFCGCHSLQEVIRNLTGIVIPQQTIASVAGTTTAGTGHYGLETAVAWFNKTYKFNLKVEWKNFSDLGWTGINKILQSNNKDCIIHNLYRDEYGHYEVINSINGSNVVVQNSLGSQSCGSCYCGYIENRSTSTFQSYINGISQKSIMVVTNE